MILVKENRCPPHGRQRILYSLPTPGIQGECAIGTFFLIIRVCSKYFYASHHISPCTFHTYEKAVSLLPKASGAVLIILHEASQYPQGEPHYDTEPR